MTTQITISGLQNNQPYLVQVAAVNDLGQGPWSAVAGPAAPAPDASYLINYVRQLTGVFSKDILTDDLLLFWMNEAYSELARLFDWPWLPITPLSLDEAPAFDSDFTSILAYRVAPRVLELEADESPRAEAYRKEYQNMLTNMYKHLLRAQDVGNPTSMSDLVLFVRALLDEFSQSLDNAMIENKIMNVHDELVRSEAWVFPSPVFPQMGWSESRVLAYGAAGRLATLLEKTESLVSSMGEEFSAGVVNLRLAFQNDYSSRDEDAEALARQARTFLGNYSTRASDSLLKTWIYEEYQNLCSERSWSWLQQEATIVLPLGSSTFSLASTLVKIHEIHRVELDSNGHVNEAEPGLLVPSVLEVQYNDPRFYYAVDHMTGDITIAPEQTKEITLRIRYEVVPESGYLMPTTIDGMVGDNFTGFAIPTRFKHILSYRAAMRAGVILEVPQSVYDMCANSATSLYEAMYNDYQMGHTQEPFQIGGNALETRKYVPWFRAE
jgi:hypothetical protein